MISILRDLGIQDYDPGVLTQMLEFSYRFVEYFKEEYLVHWLVESF